MIGTLLDGRYRILELISEDDATRVYKARHELLSRQMSIKMFKTDLFGGEESRKRFQSESKALSVLNHPNIVKVFDSGIGPDGEPYLAMDYLEGETLAGEIEKCGTLSAERVARMFSRACDALGHAHQSRVIHTALSPNCIILSGAGPDDIQITNFGLSKLLSLDKPEMFATQTAERFSNPRYMSPEQCVGRAVDPRSDVYSLACVMYEALTGNTPYQGDTAVEIVSQHISPNPVPPPVVNENSQEIKKLVPVIMKALEKDSGKRYQSMKEFKSELDACCSAPTQRAGKIPVPKDSARAFGLALLISAVSILIIAGAFWLLARTDEGLLLLTRLKLTLESSVFPQNDPRLENTAEQLLSLYERCGRNQEAADLLKRMEGDIEVKYGKESPQAFESQLRLGRFYLKHGDRAAAKKICKDIIDFELRHIDDLMAHNKGDVANDELPRLIEAHDVAYEPGDPKILTTIERVARTRVLDGQFQLSLPLFTRALEIRRTMPNPDRCQTAEVLHHLGWVYEGLGQTKKAYNFLLESWQIAKDCQLTEDSYRLPIDLAVLSLEFGRVSEAEDWYRKAYDYETSLPFEAAPDLYVETLDGLANTCRQEGKWHDAEEALKEAIARESEVIRTRPKLISMTGLSKPPFKSTLHRDLAAVYAAEGKSSQARKEYDIALKLADSAPASLHRSLVGWFDQYPRYQQFKVLTAYAKFLEKQGEKDEAKVMLQRVSDIAKQGKIEQPPWPDRPISKFLPALSERGVRGSVSSPESPLRAQ